MNRTQTLVLTGLFGAILLALVAIAGIIVLLVLDDKALHNLKHEQECQLLCEMDDDHCRRACLKKWVDG